MLTAVKRVRGMRLIGPAWKRREERSRDLVPVANRSLFVTDEAISVRVDDGGRRPTTARRARSGDEARPRRQARRYGGAQPAEELALPAAAQPQVEIWTDGACKGNPGPGGWGALLRAGVHEKELFGGEPATTTTGWN